MALDINQLLPFILIGGVAAMFLSGGSMFSNIGNGLGQGVAGIGAGLGQGVSNLGNGIGQGAQNAVGGIMGAVFSPFQAFGSLF